MENFVICCCMFNIDVILIDEQKVVHKSWVQNATYHTPQELPFFLPDPVYYNSCLRQQTNVI